jgi:hypothetical protein
VSLPLLVIALVVATVGLVICALLLRSGMLRGDRVLTIAALVSAGAFLFAVVWLSDAL